MTTQKENWVNIYDNSIEEEIWKISNYDKRCSFSMKIKELSTKIINFYLSDLSKLKKYNNQVGDDVKI